jgi:lysophospholipase L1-like esterase
MGRFVRALRASVVILFGVALGLGSLELYARLAKLVGYGSQRVVDTVARDESRIAAIVKGDLRLPADATRILVLGDSMAASPGVSRDDLWSTRLEGRLSREYDRDVVVINAAVPADNTWAELERARTLVPAMKPAIVLLMYNTNDVYGARGRGTAIKNFHQATAIPKAERKKTVRPNVARTPQGSLLSKSIALLKRRSVMLDLFLTRLNLQLKSWGILIPGSEFHHMVTKAYASDYTGWRDVQNELLDLRDLCQRYQTQLLVYSLPDFDALRIDHTAGVRRILTDYFREIGVPARFGFAHFQGRSWNELAVSPFDGHPNPRANREIAELLFEWIREMKLIGMGVREHGGNSTG